MTLLGATPGVATEQEHTGGGGQSRLLMPRSFRVGTAPGGDTGTDPAGADAGGPGPGAPAPRPPQRVVRAAAGGGAPPP
ncbi:hypothetical protein ACFV9B_41400, partial [Kitasatospora purpeofusca]